MTAVLTLLTPLAADLSVWVLVVVRALEGLFEVGGTISNYRLVIHFLHVCCIVE